MPRGGLKRTATSLSIDTELSEKRKSAEYHSASNAFEAEREERQARDRFLSAGASTKDEEEESSRRLEHIEKLVLEVTEKVEKLQDKLVPPPGRGSTALAAVVRSASPPPRRSSLLPYGGRAEDMTPLHAKLHAKLDSLSKQVERLAAGAPREQAPPPREVPNEQHSSSRPGAGEAEDMSALHVGLEVISQPAYQLQTQRSGMQGAWRPAPPPPPG